MLKITESVFILLARWTSSNNYCAHYHQPSVPPLSNLNWYFLSLQNTTLMQLKKAYYNRKPVERPRNKKTMMEETCENASTEEGHASQLIKEMRKKTPDVKTIHSLLTVSFNHRRKWITKLQGKGTVKRILEEYPGFRSFPQVILRFRATYFCSCFKQRPIWKVSCHRSIVLGLLRSFNGKWQGFSIVCSESELGLVELFTFPG